jgi:hypothetical protein
LKWTDDSVVVVVVVVMKPFVAVKKFLVGE